MSKSLEEKIHSIELDIASMKGDIKVIANAIVLYGDLEKRVRALEDYKNRLIGWAAAIGAIAGTITAVIVKLL